MQQTEVTNGEISRHLAELGGAAACQEWWKRFGQLKTYLRDDEGLVRQHPAGALSWHTAKLYAGKRGGRLPSEAQWEYAARSQGRNLLRVWDFNEKRAVPQPPMDRLANINTVGNTTEDTAGVKRYPEDVTAQGIFDLTGNVREWCRDVWKPTLESLGSANDPGPAPDHAAGAGDRRVVRGGSFQTPPEFGQTINRDEPQLPEFVTNDIGLRIVIECPGSRGDPR
jgi:formylglycine-generating enzyme required for sulfatase activity